MTVAEPGAADRRLWRAAWDLLALAGPLTVLTGMLYYFGWASAQSFYAYFGVSLSALDFSTTSYLVGTADTLFRPLATLLIVVIVSLIGHHLYRRVLGSAGPDRRRHITVGLLTVSAVLAVVGLAGLYGTPHGLASPLALAGAPLLLEYGLWSVTRFMTIPAPLRDLIDAGRAARRGIVAAVVLVGLFWAVTNLAHARGAENARLVEDALPALPQAVVYSEKDLQLPGPRVAVARLTGPDSAYAFRYNGLRPLLHANGRWFLLPVGWRHDNGATVIILDDEPGHVRVDLAPGRG